MGEASASVFTSPMNSPMSGQIRAAGGNLIETHFRGGYHDHHHVAATGPLSSSLYNTLCPAAQCSFNSVNIPSYHPDTRTELFKELDKWIKSDERPICWLTGPVGSGKTFIARALAQKCSEQHTLVANYFFDRGKRNEIVTLVRSLAYTMCASHKAAIPVVEHVLHHDPNILQDSNRRYQFMKLLLDVFPTILQEIQKEKQTNLFTGVVRPKIRLVVVIDGIDGCDDREEMKEFIKMLVEISSASSPGFLHNIRILLTGRIGNHFKSTRDSPVFRRIVKEINLQDIDAKKDIQRFFQYRLDEIRQRSPTSSFTERRTSQSDTQLGDLVKLSKGSFHFAETILRFLDHDDTNRRVYCMLQNSDDCLYDLFTEELNNTRGRRSPHFKEVLGTIAYLSYPLSLTALRRLLHPVDPLPSLLCIHSLLSIPADDDKAIEPICGSLWEYLKTSKGSKGYRFDGLKSHFSLATSCLLIAAQLSDGEGESSCTERSMSLGWVKTAEVQQYASVHWVYHLLESFKFNRWGRLEEIKKLLHQGNVLEQNISVLLNSSFVLWTNILIFKIDDTQSILEDLNQLNENIERIECSQNLISSLSEVFHKLKREIKSWNKFIKKRTQASQAGFGTYGVGTSSPKSNNLENIGHWRKQQQEDKARKGAMGSPKISRSSTVNSASPLLPEPPESIARFSQSDFPWSLN